MKKILIIALMVCGVNALAQPTSTDIWINEFHYDGVTTFSQSDQNEFVEIIVKKTLYDNVAEFAKLKLVLYTSGAIDQTGLTSGRGLPYNQSSLLFTLAETEYPLTGFQACAATSTEYMVLSKPMSNLQDIPAGFALVYNNASVVQLLSYEKVFNIAPATAGGGVAADLNTTVIRTATGDTARETATTPNNHSISLIGSGVAYNNFTWTDQPTQTATPCAVNGGQTLASGAPLPVRWLDLKALGQGNNIYTQWLVGDDQQTLQYEIELKGGGFGTYTKRATVARQTSGSQYQQIITGMANGKYLLRIKAIEANGKSYYSAERLVTLGKNAGSVNVYPNPVRNNNALLQFVATENSLYVVHIIDATGRIVKQQSLGNMKADQMNTVSLALSDVLPGTYTIRLKGNTEEIMTRLVIVR